VSFQHALQTDPNLCAYRVRVSGRAPAHRPESYDRSGRLGRTPSIASGFSNSHRVCPRYAALNEFTDLLLQQGLPGAAEFDRARTTAVPLLPYKKFRAISVVEQAPAR